MKRHAYRISWIAFALALLSVALIPVTVFASDDGRPGWDQLGIHGTVVVGGPVIAVLLLAVSFVSGLFAWRQRKVTLLWVVPSGLVVLPSVAVVIAWLLWPIVAPLVEAIARRL